MTTFLLSLQFSHGRKKKIKSFYLILCTQSKKNYKKSMKGNLNKKVCINRKTSYMKTSILSEIMVNQTMYFQTKESEDPKKARFSGIFFKKKMRIILFRKVLVNMHYFSSLVYNLLAIKQMSRNFAFLKKKKELMLVLYKSQYKL